MLNKLAPALISFDFSVVDGLSSQDDRDHKECFLPQQVILCYISDREQLSVLLDKFL